MSTRLTPQQQRIVEALQDAPGGLSASQLAGRLGSTPESIKVLVHHARAKGVHITKARSDPHAPRVVDGRWAELYRLTNKQSAA